jgi:hypothetical protein
MTTPLPTPSVEELNKIMAPHLDDAEHKRLRAEQEKLNHATMAETAKHRPTPSVAEMNAAAATPGGTVEKVSEPEHHDKENAAGYKTREAKAAKHG